MVVDVTASTSVRRRVRSLREHLDVPFVRNAYSLVGSTLATSGLGVIFWIVAARMFSTEDVGRDSALISTMLFLSSISQLNLTNGFNRFVPVAGHRTRRLVFTGYGLATTTALVASTVFVLGVNLWSPRLALLQNHWEYAAWFVFGTVIWTLFALQDAVLTGLGEARWVLIENIFYGVVKLGLLVTIAAALPVLGVYASWTLPLIAVVIAVNVLIFRRFVPQREHEPLEEIDAQIVRRYVGFDMVATLMLSATIGLLPVLVLSILGPSASAYLYLSWTIAYTLYLISIGVGMSFVTETARAPERIVEYARKMIKHSLRIVAPIAVVIALGAPLILRVFGPAYSAHATHLLQLLALSAIPNAVTVTYLNIGRIQRRLSLVIITTGALAAGVITLSVILCPIIGVTGVGVAWFASQTTLAIVLLLGELRTVWLPYVHVDRVRSWRGGAGIEARSARVERGGRDRSADGAAALRAAGQPMEEWDVVGVTDDADEVRVVTIHHRKRGADAVLKVGASARAIATVRAGVDGLRHVREVAPPELLTITPELLSPASGAGKWSLETRRPGVDARTIAGDSTLRDAVSFDLVARINGLYRATATAVAVGDELPELLDLPLGITDSLPTSRMRVRADETSLARLQSELRAELTGSTITAASVHGNLWLGAVLCSPEDRAVTGLVSWERTRLDLPVVELMHLVCTSRAMVDRLELGAVVRDVLSVGDFHDAESELITSAPGAAELSTRTALLLMWLRHVHGFTRRAGGTRPSDVWVSHNVHQVLESV
jgi:O-antigen/teichoic acid export membrane protein